MVQDTISILKPKYIILELCEERIDNLFEKLERNITLSEVCRECYKQKSMKVLGMGLLSWMQLKAAKLLGKM